MHRELHELPEEWRALVSELAGDAEISTVSISEDGSCINLYVWVDSAPYLQVYERDPLTRTYKLHTMHALGQVKF